MMSIGPSLSIDINNGASGGGSPSFPLDSLPSPLRVFSLSRMLSSYLGASFNVRRDSDNAEQDIGFLPNGSLDVASLLSFCGSGNGFVTRWYDQSVNGADVGQGSGGNQAQIVDTGAVIIFGSTNYPSMYFDGNYDFSGIDAGLPAGASPRALVGVYSSSRFDGAFGLFGWGTVIPTEYSGISCLTSNVYALAYAADVPSGFPADSAYIVGEVDYDGTQWLTYQDAAPGNTGGYALNTVLNGNLSVGATFGLFTGYCSTAIIFGQTLTDSQRLRIVDKLQAIFGTT
jgi:hypothetical protein